MLFGLGFRCLSSTKFIIIWFVVVSVVDLYFSIKSCNTSKLLSKYPNIFSCCFGITIVLESTTTVLQSSTIVVDSCVVASVVVYIKILKYICVI